MNPAAISTFPQGLLDFLGIKNGGAYPSSLVNQYQPVLDLLTWTAQANSRLLTGAYPPFNATTGGQGILMPDSPTQPSIVPNGEMWILLNYTLRVTMTAAAGSNMAGIWPAVAISPMLQPLSLPCTPIGSITSSATVAIIAETQYEGPFFMPPGSQLAAAMGGFVFGAASPAQVIWAARVVRARL